MSHGASQEALSGEESEEKDGCVEEDVDEACQADVKGCVYALTADIQAQVVTLDEIQHCHLTQGKKKPYSVKEVHSVIHTISIILVTCQIVLLNRLLKASVNGKNLKFS